MFCRPSAFSVFFEGCSKEVERLETVVEEYQSPELIDDGEQTAPSKRIIDIFPDYGGAKSAAGPQIAEEIGLETVRRLCPHFHAWLTKLEQLQDQ